VICEDLPSHGNLIGRVEYQAQMGTLVTDFSLIKAGALHRANGGYLILDARQVLLQPFAWDGLKRALQARAIRLDSLERSLSLISTVSLEPEHIPLDVKVVLVGERLLYYLLSEHDPDFADLFKVMADFDETMKRSPDACQLYARLFATLAREHQLRPLDRAAIARLIEHAARLAGDAEKTTTHLRSLTDLLREADYWAGAAGHATITRDDIQHTIGHQTYRVERVRERVYENIHRGTLLIDTAGERIGQINGLSVLQLGQFAFGQPTRITATTRLGEGKVIDIERETELGGPIHSKGVLILSSFLAARYAAEQPLSLAASLVFEQSYGMVEGDSASLAELCALLSALAGLPLRQSLAVTGSVNQLGRVQPIGGVNEKVEGFFDVCEACGLTGEQGVIIPAANVKHLMLRHDVVAAAGNGQFRIWAVSDVDQAVELLTGTYAGEADSNGNFPPDSVNGRVAARLTALSELRRRFAGDGKKQDQQNA
jgi:lon-related putative ATP-dependent protease